MGLLESLLNRTTVLGADLAVDLYRLGPSRLLGINTGNAWLSARDIGKRGPALEDRLLRETEDYDESTKSTMSSGTLYGILAAEEFGSMYGARAEEPVRDERLRVKGFIDIYLPDQNIPIEVKTISSEGLAHLTRPLQAHESQLNFYLHAKKADYGYVMYMDAMNASNRKIYKVGYQPGRLLADVKEAATTILTSNVSNKNAANWYSSVYQEDIRFNRGIRQSSGFAGNWEGMQAQTQDFEHGRIASQVQASRYKNLNSGAKLKPTMGLTIRLHDFAIGHGRSHSRSISPTVKYNNSRRMR